MGSRANVAIVQYEDISVPEGTNPPAIFVYLHWGGSSLPQNLQAALLAAKPRWTDEPYGTHILIDQLTKEGRDQETGYGIGLCIGDNEYPVLVVDMTNEKVRVISEGDASKKVLVTGTPIREFTFSEYLSLQFGDDGNQWAQLQRQPAPAS